jgi:hypothetical protein
MIERRFLPPGQNSFDNHDEAEWNSGWNSCIEQIEEELGIKIADLMKYKDFYHMVGNLQNAIAIMNKDGYSIPSMFLPDQLG